MESYISSTQKMLIHLKRGETVGTTNDWCHLLFCNQVPDVARKLINLGYPLKTNYKMVQRRGRRVKVAEYYFDKNYLKTIRG